METFVALLTLEDRPESFRPTLKAVRSSAGEALVLDENMFIEKMLPRVTNLAFPEASRVGQRSESILPLP